MLTEGDKCQLSMTYFHFIRYVKQNVVLGWYSYNKFFSALTNLWYQNVFIWSEIN